jgi:UDP-N-acetylglucosamine 2-epimerase (non-hydrolysing)
MLRRNIKEDYVTQSEHFGVWMGTGKFRVLSVVGTRPEAIKMAPLALAAAAHPQIEHRLVATGQHDLLLDQAIAAFGLKVDELLALGHPGQSIDALATRVAAAVGDQIARYRPHLLMVQGDTTTAWAAAYAARSLGVPVGHIEAGLRSHDPLLPWPEERNRVEIDAVSTLLFAPTEQAAANLHAEAAIHGSIHVTGNTGIDALMLVRERLGPIPPRDPAERRILATVHRRENIAALAEICAALRQLAERPDVRVLLPVHPNPRVRAGVEAALQGAPRVSIIEPLGYPDMVRLMLQADLLLSDSGGLQEEAPALGLPMLVLRANSERPEALATGNVVLVGTEPDRIVAAAGHLLDDPAAHAAMARPAFPYGRGDAAAKIWAIVEAWAGFRDAETLLSRPSART